MPKTNIRPIPKLRPDQIERFLDKIVIGADDECWPWTGSKNENGYGGVRINDQLFKAPRIAYFLHYGIDPGPLHVCHRCDDPPCCNPRHFFLGTIKENCDDSAAKGRSKILYKSGDDNPARIYPERHVKGQDTYNAVLTNDDVIEIRDRYSAGWRATALAAEFGISHGHVCDIVARRRWKHI